MNYHKIYFYNLNHHVNKTRPIHLFKNLLPAQNGYCCYLYLRKSFLPLMLYIMAIIIALMAIIGA